MVTAATAIIGSIFCAVLPLAGCIGFGILYGAIGGGVAAGIIAAGNGASNAGIQRAFFIGAASGAISGLLRPLGSRIAAALKSASGIG